MKVTRKELNTIIENYLLQERYKNRGNYEVKIAQCDFNFDDDFLNIIEIVKAGGKIPNYGAGSSNDDKPDWMNPVFISSFTDAALPFMNMLVAPQFGIETFCNTMQKLNRMFNDLYREYKGGLQRAEPEYRNNDSSKKNKDKDYNKNISIIIQALKNEKVGLTRSRMGPLLNRPGIGTLSKHEIKLAHYLLGDLEKAKTTNQRAVNNVIDAFKYDKITNFDQLKLAAAKGSAIGDWSKDKQMVEDMLLVATQRWATDPDGQGVDNVKQIYQKIFNKIKNENLI